MLAIDLSKYRETTLPLRIDTPRTAELKLRKSATADLLTAQNEDPERFGDNEIVERLDEQMWQVIRDYNVSEVWVREIPGTKRYVLSRNYVEIADSTPPNELEKPDGFSASELAFDNASNPSWAGVIAWALLDSMFGRMKQWGIDVWTYFGMRKDDDRRQPFLAIGTYKGNVRGQPFPIDVQAAIGTDEGDGRVINARVRTSDNEDRILAFEFALARIDPDVSIALIPQVVWHEFGHALQIATLKNKTLIFTHSIGDSLAAINCDPGPGPTPPPDFWNDYRHRTFPLLARLSPHVYTEERRHDRKPQEGWSWGGRFDNSFSGSDPDGYISEQILSSTLFDIYRELGGDKAEKKDRERAANYITYLIVICLWRLRVSNRGRRVTSLTADQFAESLIDVVKHPEVDRGRHKNQHGSAPSSGFSASRVEAIVRKKFGERNVSL